MKTRIMFPASDDGLNRSSFLFVFHHVKCVTIARTWCLNVHGGVYYILDDPGKSFFLMVLVKKENFERAAAISANKLTIDSKSIKYQRAMKCNFKMKLIWVSTSRDYDLIREEH